MFLKILKWFGVGLAGLFGLVILAYGVLVAINWSDEPPSETYLAFEAELEGLDSLDLLLDPENAVPYSIGLSVARDENPREVGEEWIRWTQLPLSEQRQTEEPDPWSENAEPLPDVLNRFLSLCWRSIDSECAAFLEESHEQFRPALAEVRKTARYERLLDYSVWREPVLRNVTTYPSYPVPIGSSRAHLHGLRAYDQARRGEFQEAINLLDKEARFSRFVLEESSNFLVKATLAQSMEINILWANEVLRLARAESDISVLTAWLEPLTRAERSMRGAMAADLALEYSIYKEFLETDDVQPSMRAFQVFLGPLLSIQGSVNLLAEMYNRVDKALDVPFRELPGAQERGYEDLREKHRGIRLRNPVGHYLFRRWRSPGYSLSYGLRVADIEGARRVLMLAQQLRAEGVAPEDVPARLQTADIRNPYTEAPFGWDAEAGEIIFEGLAPGDRNKFRLKY